MRSFVEIAPGVLVMTADKYVTTSTLVLRDDRVVIIDPAWTEADLDGIVAYLAQTGRRITTGLSTHNHYDHVLWHPAFGDAPRWGSVRTFEIANASRDEILRHLAGDIPTDWPHPVDGLMGLDGSFVPDPFDDGAPEPIEFVLHDAHTPGHTAIWFPERGVVTVGDMLSDVELPMPFYPPDLDAYLDGLDVLVDVVARADVMVPGHGTPTTDGMARLDADRRYLDDVLHGRAPSDDRLHLPEQDDVHRRIVELATQLG
jgi:glyoxylase-like metal-dependent hydrolase (beta-lactamase superfamily II)